MDTLTYRRYEKSDLDICTELSEQAWPVVLDFADAVNASSFVKAYVLNNLCNSNYAEVCCDGDKIVGFLFANLKDCPDEKIEKSGNFKLFFDFISGRYGKVKKQYQLLFGQMLATMKTEHICRKFDGEIMLFVVASEYRGHGIGKTLINNVLSYAKTNNLKSIFLATDPMCNWAFYEKIGFSRYSEFYDNALSILMKKRANTYIYYMSLMSAT
jgi:ribosomal protein S18 acetylase RimI-like enzyme